MQAIQEPELAKAEALRLDLLYEQDQLLRR